MSIPICHCKSRFQFPTDIGSSTTVEHCPLHAQVGEFYELLEMQIDLRGPETLHDGMPPCRCWSCRAVRALRKARLRPTPELGLVKTANK